jgi:hypothetical protein
MGYGLIGNEWADRIHEFYTQHLNPYLNFHRPCGFATIEINQRGKRRRHYRADDYRTPYEKLTSRFQWKTYLKPDVTPQSLSQLATQHSDTEAAPLMQKARNDLLRQARSSRAGPASPQVSPWLGGAKGLE